MYHTVVVVASCPQGRLLMFRGPITLKQPSGSLLNALRFFLGSLSFLFRSLLFGLMILLWCHSFQHQMSVRVWDTTRSISHHCFVTSAAYAPLILLLYTLGSSLQNFLQLASLPHLFGLHFHLSSPSPSLQFPLLLCFSPYPSLSFNFSLSLSPSASLSPLIDIWGWIGWKGKRSL